MTDPARAPEGAADALHPDLEIAAKAAGVWINQLARTLKTCRLYDASNPTVAKFRLELSSALRRLLEVHGPLQLRFSADDVRLEEVSLYPAKSREDNLALPFFRDGIRAITFTPGIESREVEILLDAVLKVTGPGLIEDDLVTLLWEAALPHVEISYVPSEGDMGSGTSAAPEEGAALVPWPTAAGDEDADETPEPEPERPEGAAGATSRSDDWTSGELTVEIEAGYEELETLAGTEMDRFRAEFQAERDVSLITSALAFGNALLRSGARPEDRKEIAAFLPRVLRQAVGTGGWLEAREAVMLLHECGGGEWSVESFAQELLQPISVSAAVQQLEAGAEDDALHFIAFARELGDPGLDWLNLVLAENQNRRQRRMLAEAIGAACKDRPERLAPWIADPRWYVVRNVVHILGWIGGPGIVPLLQVAARNSDPRVRHEVVGSLARVDLKHARALLVKMLDGADTRMFVSILHLLGQGRDTVVARLLLGYLQDPEFDNRPADEKNAIYNALATAAGDDAVADLEAELHRTQWFSRQQEAHRQAVARVLARIGTPTARMVLERGLQSRRAPVRQACEGALPGFRDAA